MRRIFVLFVSVALLSVTALGHAVSPDIVRAVAERPVTLQLESGGKIDGEVLSRGETTFVVADTDGDIYELAYDDVKSIRVRAASAAPAPAAQQAAQEAPTDARARAVAYADERDARERAQANRRPIDGNVSRAGQPYAQEQLSYPRLFARASLDLGFGSLRLHTKYVQESYGELGTISDRTRGFAFGGDFALGARLSEKLAVHATFGIRRAFSPAVRRKKKEDGETDTDSFESTDNKVRMMNVGIGFTVLSDNVVFSASFGAGQGRVGYPDDWGSNQRWGFGGDVMVGYAYPVSNVGRVGVALAATWVATLNDVEQSNMWGDVKEKERWSAYTIGPRVFFMY